MSPLTVTLRSRAEVAGLIAGLEPVDPGLVPVDEWRPTPGEARPGRAAPVYAVVARKPALSGRVAGTEDARADQTHDLERTVTGSPQPSILSMA